MADCWDRYLSEAVQNSKEMDRTYAESVSQVSGRNREICSITTKDYFKDGLLFSQCPDLDLT